MLGRHPEELNLSAYALQEVLFLHKLKAEAQRRELEKLKREHDTLWQHL